MNNNVAGKLLRPRRRRLLSVAPADSGARGEGSRTGASAGQGVCAGAADAESPRSSPPRAAVLLSAPAGASRRAPVQKSFRVEKRLATHAVIVAPVGELDASTVAQFEAAIASVVGLGRSLVIDLGRLGFIDSCGLWSITTTSTACRQRGIRLFLRPGPERVQDVFEATGLYDLLPFTDRLGGGAP